MILYLFNNYFLSSSALARSLGEAGQIEPETQAMLIEMDVDDSPFSEEVKGRSMYYQRMLVALPITGFSRSDLALDLRLEPCFQKKDSWSKISLICIIFIPQD